MQRVLVSCDIPEPVLFNCWKHHAGFIKSRIKEFKENHRNDPENIRKEILLIGGSLMDLYLGELTPAEIARSITTYLDLRKVTGMRSYREWLGGEGRDFREVEIEDHSGWTLRLGEKKERYIHIHPSRYSPHTIRVRSSSLKSAILFCALHDGETENILADINRVRKEFLNLPPLKNLKSGSALFNLIKTLS
jgi:hypothetical protein